MNTDSSKGDEGLGKNSDISPTEQEQEQVRGGSKKVEDAAQGLEKTLVLLKAKDDTSRFVGLAFLKSILDNREDLQKDVTVVKSCWEAVPAKFLDRLLRAPASLKNSKEESQSMVELAVAVLHAFLALLPEDSNDDEKFLGRIERLLGALSWSPPDTKIQIFQILLSLVSTQRGSIAVLSSEHWFQLLEPALQDALAFDVVVFAWLNIPSETLQEPKIQEKATRVLPLLNDLFPMTSKHVLILRMLHRLLPLLPTDSSPANLSWLGSLVDFIYQSCLSQQAPITAKIREAAIILAAKALHSFPFSFPSLMFGGARLSDNSGDSKPLSYLFVKLLIVDIRSSIPSLQTSLSSNDLPTLERIAASYDILSTFIGFLIQLLDESPDLPTPPVQISPSLLLRLRADISEAMSLTIEFLRDRFDKFTSQPITSNLTDSIPTPSVMATKDPLTLSQLQTLALWLREDDNHALREEASSLIYVFITLYALDNQSLEFRSPILIALEGILNVPQGVEAFLAADGWSVLTLDLQTILSLSSGDTPRGIEIVRILLSVAESDVVGPAKEAWMEIINLACFVSSHASSDDLELKVSIAQLAVEVLTRAPRNVRRKWMGAANQVCAMASGILRRENLEDSVRDGAEEVLYALQFGDSQAGGRRREGLYIL